MRTNFTTNRRGRILPNLRMIVQPFRWRSAHRDVANSNVPVDVPVDVPLDVPWGVP